MAVLAGGRAGTDGGPGQSFPELFQGRHGLAEKRYSDEVHRLFGVMNKRLATHKFLAGA